MDNFRVIQPVGGTSPLILSIPHCGTAFPDDIVQEYKQEMLPPDDTDWFVDRLYSFASEYNITIIAATCSRWVIDLNRNPDGQSLYNDGRLITALCPTTNFLGQAIYKDERHSVAPGEIQRRKELYFEPYHNKIQELVNAAKNHFGKALLWDCHSIRRSVPAIHPQPFPDLILGSADGTSASPAIIDKAVKLLGNAHYSFSHNYPFKGGYITRHFGKPHENQHALQLEMAKQLYMDDSERMYDEERAIQVQTLLKQTLTALHPLLLQE
ncbi:N-formylglutamate deformylase [Ilyomonas limi]|uniref:N-formylglutamate deformylase n=1 Tax=Ilyomonas limi TaxID=2575867 RepID=A0A4U3KY01_9BACT|nr:N-formylglutamate amidohydrolase [Ilyomonas limi]TKK66604.1 N-formylglutamate deformylase [Ilyomonas limi]